MESQKNQEVLFLSLISLFLFLSLFLRSTLNFPKVRMTKIFMGSSILGFNREKVDQSKDSGANSSLQRGKKVEQ